MSDCCNPHPSSDCLDQEEDNRPSVLSADVTRRDFLQIAGAGAIASAALPAAAFAEGDTDGQDVGAADGEGGTDDTDSNEGWHSFTFLDHDEITSKFYFDDSLFDDSAFTYNPSLSTFACSFAAASFGAYNKVNAYADNDAAKNVRALFEELGMQDAEFCDYDKKTSRDTIGSAIAHTRIETANGVEKEHVHLIMVSLRGGYYFLEWAGNMLLGTSGDHQGFTIAATQVVARIKDYVKTYNLTGKAKVLLVGYSRSGATANLAAGTMLREAAKAGAAYDAETGYELSSLFGDGGITLAQSDLYVYSFEPPAPRYTVNDTDDLIAKQAHGFDNIHCFVNPCDPVPMVAPAIWDFDRFGDDYLLPAPLDGSYTLARKAMQERYDSLKSTLKYSVDEFKQGPANIFMRELVNKLAQELFVSRATYCANYQDGAVCGMEDYYSGTINKELLVKAWNLFVDWVLGADIDAEHDDMVNNSSLPKWLAETKFYAYKYAVVAARMAKLLVTKVIANSTSGTAACKAIVSTYVGYLKEAGMPWTETEQKLFGMLEDRSYDILRFLLKNPSLVMVVPALSSFVESITQFKKLDVKGGLINGDLGRATSSHHPVAAIAWTQSLDPHFNTALAAQTAALTDEADANEGTPLTGHRELVVMGMVTVDLLTTYTVYHLFVDGEPQDVEDAPIMFGLDPDCSMRMYLNEGDDFLFNVTAGAGKSFTVTAMTFDPGETVPTSVTSFADISPEEESTFGITVNEDGMGLQYEGSGLLAAPSAGSDVPWDEEASKDVSGEGTQYQIDADTADFSQGLVLGGGSRINGEYCLLFAYPLDGYEFDYWTLDGTKVEDEPETHTIDESTNETMTVYALYADDNHEVVAHFKKREQESDGKGNSGTTPTMPTTPTTPTASTETKDSDTAKKTGKGDLPRTGDNTMDAVGAVAAVGVAAAVAGTYAAIEE